MHRRTRPAGAQRSYGVLAGQILQGKEYGGGTSPHYEILVEAGADRYRLAVNVRSVDGSDVLAYIDPSFDRPTRTGLATLQPGFTALATGPDGQGLDYLRDDLFPLDEMRPVPPDGSDTSLSRTLDAAVAAAIAAPGSRVFAFGQYFTDPGADQNFGFTPERGVHDIHMMQGNAGSFADDNTVRGDGALFLRGPVPAGGGAGTIFALFVRFTSQSISTDPATGAPA